MCEVNFKNPLQISLHGKVFQIPPERKKNRIENPTSTIALTINYYCLIHKCTAYFAQKPNIAASQKGLYFVLGWLFLFLFFPQKKEKIAETNKLKSTTNKLP
jgi:hypothetical protein